MGGIRPERVAERVQREVTDILTRKLRDPRLLAVTVTDVEVTADLKLATVFVSTLSAGPEREAALTALKRAAPRVRRELAPRLSLREVPEVRFRFDESVERGARVEDLLRRLKSGEPVEDDESTW